MHNWWISYLSPPEKAEKQLLSKKKNAAIPSADFKENHQRKPLAVLYQVASWYYRWISWICLRWFFYFLPWDSSPFFTIFHHHLGEYVFFFFQASNRQIQDIWHLWITVFLNQLLLSTSTDAHTCHCSTWCILPDDSARKTSMRWWLVTYPP